MKIIILSPHKVNDRFSFSSIDLIHDTRHLCTRLTTDGIKAIPRGFQGANKRKTLPMEEIAVEFVFPRQQEMKTFSS